MRRKEDPRRKRVNEKRGRRDRRGGNEHSELVFFVVRIPRRKMVLFAFQEVRGIPNPSLLGDSVIHFFIGITMVRENDDAVRHGDKYD